MRHCPDCHTDQVIKNGSNGTGKPKYACKACGHQFVGDPAWRAISDEIKGIIDRLFDRLYTDWASLDKFQRTRGVLRLMAAVI